MTMQWSGSPLLLLLQLLLALVRGDNYFLLETYKDSADSQSGTVHTVTTHSADTGHQTYLSQETRNSSGRKVQTKQTCRNKNVQESNVHGTVQTERAPRQ